MAVSAKSEFIKAAKSYGKEMVQANKDKGSSITSDQEVCDILKLEENVKKTFDAKLSKVRYGIDKNKCPYFAFDFVLTTGKKGLNVGDFIGIPKDKEAREKKLKLLAAKFSSVGVNLDDSSPTSIMADMAEAADSLSVSKPYVTLSLSRYVRQDGGSSLNCMIVSMSEEPSEEDVRAVAVESEEAIDFISLGELADGGDADAEAALTAIGEQLEVDVNDYATWSEFAAYAHEELTVPEAEEEEPAEEEATDDGEQYDEAVEVSDEDIEYYNSCIGYPGTFTDEEGTTMQGTATAYDPETNIITMEGDDGTVYDFTATDVAFE